MANNVKINDGAPGLGYTVIFISMHYFTNTLVPSTTYMPFKSLNR